MQTDYTSQTISEKLKMFNNETQSLIENICKPIDTAFSGKDISIDFFPRNDKGKTYLMNININPDPNNQSVTLLVGIDANGDIRTIIDNKNIKKTN